MTIEAVREKRHVRFRVSTIIVSVVHASNRREVNILLAIFFVGIHIVALLPVKLFALSRNIIWITAKQVRIAVSCINSIIITPRIIIIVIAGNGICCCLLRGIPIQELQLRLRANLVRIALFTRVYRSKRLRRLAAHFKGLHVHGVAKEGAQLKRVGRAYVVFFRGKLPRAVALKLGGVQRIVAFACLICHKLIVCHLVVQGLARFIVDRAQIRIRRAQSRWFRTTLVEEAVAVGVYHTAIVVLVAKAAARNAFAVLITHVTKVVAAVAAAFFIFPIEHAHRANEFLHWPVAVVNNLPVLAYHGGIQVIAALRGVHVIGLACRGKTAQAQILQLIARNTRANCFAFLTIFVGGSVIRIQLAAIRIRALV